jgi:hypothetical protein
MPSAADIFAPVIPKASYFPRDSTTLSRSHCGRQVHEPHQRGTVAATLRMGALHCFEFFSPRQSSSLSALRRHLPPVNECSCEPSLSTSPVRSSRRHLRTLKHTTDFCILVSSVYPPLKQHPAVSVADFTFVPPFHYCVMRDTSRQCKGWYLGSIAS